MKDKNQFHVFYVVYSRAVGVISEHNSAHNATLAAVKASQSPEFAGAEIFVLSASHGYCTPEPVAPQIQYLEPY